MFCIFIRTHAPIEVTPPMIIQKMNNVLVKHGKVTFAIFTAVIIVS